MFSSLCWIIGFLTVCTLPMHCSIVLPFLLQYPTKSKKIWYVVDLLHRNLLWWSPTLSFTCTVTVNLEGILDKTVIRSLYQWYVSIIVILPVNKYNYRVLALLKQFSLILCITIILYMQQIVESSSKTFKITVSGTIIITHTTLIIFILNLIYFPENWFWYSR
jgi:hypothetical protein